MLCLVVNPITVSNFASLSNCMPAGRPSGLIKALKLACQRPLLYSWLGPLEYNWWISFDLVFQCRYDCRDLNIVSSQC